MGERKHFIAIVVLIGVLTVLFQFSAIVKGSSLDYASNHAAESAADALKIKRSNAYDPQAKKQQTGEVTARRTVTFVGPTTSPYRTAALDFAMFAKWSFAEAKSLGGVVTSHAEEGSGGVFVVDPAAVNWSKDMNRLQKIQEAGYPVVLCELPDEALIEKDSGVRTFLGISDIHQPSVELTGFHLFEGLLLGGEKEYRNTPEEEHLLDGADLEAPWYMMAGGAKVYLRGEVDTSVYPEAYAHDEIIPPLMWRYSDGFSPLFVAYGPILSRPEGFGLLTAFVTESTPYEVWPVADAQVLALNDYPVLIKENVEEMQRIYARDSISLQRDVVWGSISSLVNRTGSVPTCLLSPKLDESSPESPDVDLLRFYLRSIDELGGEAGLACDSINEAPLVSKIREDMAFLHGGIPSYKISVAGIRLGSEYETLLKLGDLLADVRTVISIPPVREGEQPKTDTQKASTGDEDSRVVGFVTDSVIRLSTSSNCWSHTVLDDLALRACETGFGYSCVTFDLKGLIYPTNKDEEWQEGYRKMLANYMTYWEPFQSLRHTTATTCDVSVRKALTTDYSSSREGDTITIGCKGEEGVAEGLHFFLKLHDERVVDVKGGSFESLNSGFYVIRLDGVQATVEVESDMQSMVVR